MSSESRRVDDALPALRAMMAAAGVPYRIVGGVAVVHHGYVRTTNDLDVLVEPEGAARLDAFLSPHGFRRESQSRLRHVATRVRVDLLLSGHPMPRAEAGAYPSVAQTPTSERDEAVVSLAALVDLKLKGGLPAHREPLLRLRRDALEEQSWERDI